MNRFRFSLVVVLAVWVSSTTAIAGMTLTVDPDAGKLSTDGATWLSSLMWNGTTIKAGGLGADGAREYMVFGDFNVGAADTVTARLGTQRGVRFIVGNNATLAGTFNFAATGQQGRAGGGIGGGQGQGGTGGVSGNGGIPGVGGGGGFGGSGTQRAGPLGNGAAGGHGHDGSDGIGGYGGGP
ncbi:MAG TPA: hypothetical protein VM431_09520, partial [Phycisphaerae bacterium]|nr:hypothetical protein [Phycisphaerae bacterium]